MISHKLPDTVTSQALSRQHVKTFLDNFFMKPTITRSFVSYLITPSIKTLDVEVRI